MSDCKCEGKPRDQHDPQTRKCKHEKTIITIEGIWPDGTVRTMTISYSSSTGVAQMNLQYERKPGEKQIDRGTPWLTRFYHDGALVREFDSKKGKYTLAIDGGCCTIPDGASCPLEE